MTLAHDLRQAIEDSPLNNIAQLAASIRMHRSGLSRYYHGALFDQHVRSKIESLAIALARRSRRA